MSLLVPGLAGVRVGGHPRRRHAFLLLLRGIPPYSNGTGTISVAETMLTKGVAGGGDPGADDERGGSVSSRDADPTLASIST
jgi:hypothetical protein